MPRTNRRTAIRAVETWAATQSGLFTLAEAESFRLTRHLVAYHARPGGRWERVLPAVYQLAERAPDPHRLMLAAQLWAGPEAVLSHRAAALILGLDGVSDPRPELWSPNGKRTGGVTVHSGNVPASDITTTGQLRHTKVLRTVLDLARVFDDDTLELVVESALRRDPRWERELGKAAISGRPGCRRLQRVLARRDPGVPPTESELETRYIQLLRTIDIPSPVRQYRVMDDKHHVLGRLDLCWPEARLWVELDGKAWHDCPDALYRDRQRQNDIVGELQWSPLRFTWRDVVSDASATAAQTERTYRRRMQS